MTPIVTLRAVARYRERVDPGLDGDGARARILASERAINAAAEFGARTVRQGCGAKLILDGLTVVTVWRDPRRGRRA